MVRMSLPDHSELVEALSLPPCAKDRQLAGIGEGCPIGRSWVGRGPSDFWEVHEESRHSAKTRFEPINGHKIQFAFGFASIHNSVARYIVESGNSVDVSESFLLDRVPAA